MRGGLVRSQCVIFCETPWNRGNIDQLIWAVASLVPLLVFAHISLIAAMDDTRVAFASMLALVIIVVVQRGFYLFTFVLALAGAPAVLSYKCSGAGTAW